MENVDIGEKVDLAKNGHQTSKAEVIDIIGSDREMGGLFDKSKIVARLRKGDRSRELRMVIKDAYISANKSKTTDNCFGKESKEMSQAKRYYERWRYLMSIGIPTVSSMRVVDELRIAMGDETSDGSDFFGKSKKESVAMELKFGKRRMLTEIERQYVGINPEEIREKLRSLQERCWAKGIRLPYDDEFDLIVHPDGSWRVLVLDLSALTKRANEPESVLDEQMSVMMGDVFKLRKDLLTLSEGASK